LIGSIRDDFARTWRKYNGDCCTVPGPTAVAGL